MRRPARCASQPTRGGLYAWEFEKDGRELKVHVEGQLVFNGTFQMLNAALAGFGLAYVPEDVAQSHLAKGRLKRVLEDWCPPYSGYHLYYPSHRQPTPAFALLVEALRYRSPRPAAIERPGPGAADGAPSRKPSRLVERVAQTG